MSLTLLLDLDDTLLNSNVDTFVPVYLKALAGYLADIVQPDAMLPALMAGTHLMMTSADPTRTLQEKFDSIFFPQIGIPRAELQSRIDRFYEEVFPTLAYATSPRPAAVELVEWAFLQGYEIAISTNPIFPLRAIEHRLRWAGLSPEKFPFKVISSYETFHFSKPHPAYLAEVLGRMGWPEAPVLVVGDDIERDISGANRLGIPAFWINPVDDAATYGHHYLKRGSIADVRPWLEVTDLSTLEPAFSTQDSVLALMLATPASLQGLLAPALEFLRTQRPVPDEWTLTEILCHLRDTEREVNLACIKLMLEEDVPFISARNTDLWAEERAYNTQNAGEALQDFLAMRMETLEILQSLSQEIWERKARHAIFGPTDLFELVNFMVEHDRLHIRQFWSTIQQIELQGSIKSG